MVRNRYLRFLLAVVLGGCAGLSYTISVLPVVLQWGKVGTQLELARVLAPLWPWIALLWAAGGFNATRVSTPLQAAVVLGLVGAVSGGLLAFLGPGLAASTLVIGVVSGAIYGGLGGLILGRVLAAPGAGEPAS